MTDCAKNRRHFTLTPAEVGKSIGKLARAANGVDASHGSRSAYRLLVIGFVIVLLGACSTVALAEEAPSKPITMKIGDVKVFQGEQSYIDVTNTNACVCQTRTIGNEHTQRGVVVYALRTGNTKIVVAGNQSLIVYEVKVTLK